MLILLDENLLSRKLKKSLVDAGHVVENVEDMGWRGVKDRELLALAAAYSFDVFITADKNLPYQQNLRELALRIVIFDVTSTRPDYLLPLMIRLGEVLNSLAAGSVTLINDRGEMMPFNPDSNG
jgi:predicted nuclease of predicted toxin-antitoxin system